MPGESSFKPSEMTEVLRKDNQQVEKFLSKLLLKYAVFELTDLSPPHPFLHPTFYSFKFRDSSGASHSFDYGIECSRHLNDKYKGLVQAFESFFESRRISDKFYEQETAEKSRAKERWWKFW